MKKILLTALLIGSTSLMAGNWLCEVQSSSMYEGMNGTSKADAEEKALKFCKDNSSKDDCKIVKCTDLSKSK